MLKHLFVENNKHKLKSAIEAYNPDNYIPGVGNEGIVDVFNKAIGFFNKSSASKSDTGMKNGHSKDINKGYNTGQEDFTWIMLSIDEFIKLVNDTYLDKEWVESNINDDKNTVKASGLAYLINKQPSLDGDKNVSDFKKVLIAINKITQREKPFVEKRRQLIDAIGNLHVNDWEKIPDMVAPYAFKLKGSLCSRTNQTPLSTIATVEDWFVLESGNKDKYALPVKRQPEVVELAAVSKVEAIAFGKKVIIFLNFCKEMISHAKDMSGRFRIDDYDMMDDAMEELADQDVDAANAIYKWLPHQEKHTELEVLWGSYYSALCMACIGYYNYLFSTRK
jgi:hypothetical protein